MKPPVNGSDGTVSVPSNSARGVTEKTLDLLRALAADGRPQQLNALARATGIPKPTTHRLLGSLVIQGFASISPGGSYRPGPLLLGLSAAVLHRTPGMDLVEQCLRDLSSRTGQTALFAVPHRDGEGARSMVVVAKVEPGQAYRINLEPGQQVSSEVTALGRALDPDQVHPGDTAFEDGEHLEGVWSVAAAVIDEDGVPIGAIGVAGLVFTMQQDTTEVFADLVRGAARAASGSRPGPIDRTTRHAG